jgi:hypothetical protein
MKRSVLFLTSLLVLALVGCTTTVPKTPVSQSTQPAKASESQSNPLERTDKQGAVVVTVTPTNLNSPDDVLNFDVSMQTHSVELSMDLTALSTLKTDTGMTVMASGWQGSRGGHHVTGTLSFPASQDGKPVLKDAKKLTLTIQKVDANARTFSWEITK